jgi:glycosyl transferase family 25
MHAYVVNLARSPDRRRHMEAQLAPTGMAYEFVDAVEGRKLDLDDHGVVDPVWRQDRTFRPGAAGCALSHLSVYRRVLDDDLEAALVLEDDVVVPPDLARLVDEVGGHTAAGTAEVVLFNFHTPRPCRVTKAGSSALAGRRLLVHPVSLHDLTSAGAYLVTRRACEQLVGAALPLRAHIDDWEYFSRQQVLERVRCVVPMPVANSPAFRTTIDYYAPSSLQARTRHALAVARLPMVSQALAARRKRTFRRWGWTGETEFVP